MPLYEYQCESCGVTFEVIQKFSDNSVDTCRACGGHVRRLLSAPAIQFKGTGWYITDYARKGTGGAEKDKAGAGDAAGTESSTASNSPAAGADTKSADGASSASSPSSPSTTSSSDQS